jgi:hypothetical protein
MASTTSFVETKEKFNLQFEQNDYVADVNDMETGPFSATTMEKYDVREEGNLSINDDIPKELIVHTNIENCEEVKTLDSFFNPGRPLVLTFGSFSWRPWRQKAKIVTSIYENFKSKVDFLAVYISEAHATDEWKLYTDVCFEQPKKIEERVEICKKFATRLHGRVKIVIDGMDNLCRDAFSAWPERLYIIGMNGKIAYKGDLGPDGYLPTEVESWLNKHVAL